MAHPRVVAAALLAPVLSAALVANNAVRADEGPDYDGVGTAIELARESHDVPGMAVAVIDDFEVVWSGEFGVAEPGRPVTATTLFQAASLSKPATAVVVAEAAERGLIDLEADALTLTERWVHPPPWWSGSVTVRMLLAHRGGVNVSGFPGYRLDEKLPDLPVILDGVVDKNAPIRVMTDPGEYEYSGGGYLIAELAVEDQTGTDFEALADALVFRPIGLEVSTYRLLSADDRARVAVGYRADGSEVAGGGWHQYPETAPGSLWTTASEYAVFIADVMRSYERGTGLVLEQSTARLLLDPDFAVGFGVDREEVGISIGHLGANEGYRARFAALPQLGEGVVVLTNSDAGDTLADDVVDVVASELSWPGQGWSTPLWLVLVVAAGLVAAAGWWVRRRAGNRMPAG